MADAEMRRLLEDLGLAHYADALAEEEITLARAKLLTLDDLKGLGLKMGPRRQLYEALQSLGDEGGRDAQHTADGAEPGCGDHGGDGNAGGDGEGDTEALVCSETPPCAEWGQEEDG
eukprot:TRINITY_DN15818_c0_g1_i1.p2 TRINITY_DN15818_c0_g1~~TRINITY_DN15818_c0_g1_i1.p2  ORF type:complete len:117 (-),score=23.52 TRINITY_DN15818_c0_g1_i1:36-386(-)